MPVQLDNDIWYLIIEQLQTWNINGSSYEKESAGSALLSLRLVNRFLALATAPHLLWHIKILKLNDTSFQRLQYLLNSPNSCEVVKRYEICPKIITSRTGELTSPYHKVPPHLDYGRNSSSPIIQSENRYLKQAAAHWEQQYRIIYPTPNKAVAALKGAFKWSGTSGKASLKDSIYFKALASFTYLQDLRITYPNEGGTRLSRVVSEEYSIALGRYLAENSSRLLILHLSSLSPNDLEIIAQAMTVSAKQSSSKPTIGITSLYIALKEVDQPTSGTLHVHKEMPSALLTLLSHMSQLQQLSMSYGIDPGTKGTRNSPNLLLSPFTSPPMPQLRALSLQRLSFSLEDLLSLVVSAPNRLTQLSLDSVSLTTSSWVQAFRTFASSDTLEYFLQPLNITRFSYHDLSTQITKRYQTEQDLQAQLQWQRAVETRVLKSADTENNYYFDL